MDALHARLETQRYPVDMLDWRFPLRYRLLASATRLRSWGELADEVRLLGEAHLNDVETWRAGRLPQSLRLCVPSRRTCMLHPGLSHGGGTGLMRTPDQFQGRGP